MKSASHLTLDDPVQKAKPYMKALPVSFVANGIGGNKEAISRLIRSVFFTRGMPHEWLQGYGITKQCKGAILYGPPGTGKTLMAKKIAELFDNVTVKIIEGPELKNQFYGKSQKDLSNLFDDARYKPDDLFVYLFDEIDALFPVRGSDGSTTTSVNNDIVSRMLAIVDGLKDLNNVVIIGTTNRIELIDPAILRAGRLEAHIYVGLPDERDRLEILQIHTKGMQQMLDVDVDLSDIARRTQNYSGSDLLRLVTTACTLAMNKNFIEKDDQLVLRNDILSIKEAEKVTQQYLLQAMSEVRPVSKSDDLALTQYRDNFITYDEALLNLINEFQRCLVCLINDATVSQLNILLHGPSGTGKTSTAIHLALMSHFPYMQLLNAAKLMKIHESNRVSYIDDIFNRAEQAGVPAVIILDDLEAMMEASADYKYYNNALRLKFCEVLKRYNDRGNKLLIIVTANSAEFMNRSGIADYCADVFTLSRLRLSLSHLQTLGAILGIEKVVPLDGEDANINVEVSVKDLLYQLAKYYATRGQSNELVMKDFIKALPAKFKLPHGVPEEQTDERRTLKAGTFFH